MTHAENYVEERTYYPDECPHDDVNAHHFQVGVYYRGQGKWMVATSRDGYRQLTHTGKWLQYPEKFQALRWCRHDFETACKLAGAAVNDMKVNGTTYSEWVAKLNARKQKEA